MWIALNCYYIECSVRLGTNWRVFHTFGEDKQWVESSALHWNAIHWVLSCESECESINIQRCERSKATTLVSTIRFTRFPIESTADSVRDALGVRAQTVSHKSDNSTIDWYLLLFANNFFEILIKRNVFQFVCINTAFSHSKEFHYLWISD